MNSSSDSSSSEINVDEKYVEDVAKSDEPKTYEERRSEIKKAMEHFDMDEFIACVLNVGTPGCALTETLKSETIMTFLSIAKESFRMQPFMIEVEGPIRICGDTHGQYSDVLRLLDRGGFPPCSNYLFLGDYVDRGHQNLEVVLLFMAYKVKYPYNFFLLRGNHECRSINRVYGFFEECQRRFDIRIWNKFQDAFALMPYVGLVGGRILCMHGGLSEHLYSLQQLRDEKRRPMDLPNPSVLMDLLWSDPDPNVDGWVPNSRGVSVVFGKNQVLEKVNQLGVDLVVRAHQVVQDGYEFFADRRLVTIFSAPHYCGQFSNNAAMLCVDADNLCMFHILQPVEKDRPVKVAMKK